MSTLCQFNRLSLNSRIDLLEKDGIYLEVFRIVEPQKIALFSLYGFYVEVWLNEEIERISKVIAFSEYKKLDPFLWCIDIESVI
jgi:hypothetical protein